MSFFNSLSADRYDLPAVLDSTWLRLTDWTGFFDGVDIYRCMQASNVPAAPEYGVLVGGLAIGIFMTALRAVIYPRGGVACDYTAARAGRWCYYLDGGAACSSLCRVWSYGAIILSTKSVDKFVGNMFNTSARATMADPLLDWLKNNQLNKSLYISVGWRSYLKWLTCLLFRLVIIWSKIPACE